MAFRSACVPRSVIVAVPLAPAKIVALPASVTLTVPLVALSWTSMFPLASTSLTVIALPLPLEKTSVAPLATVCAPGTVFTGASFVAVTVKLKLVAPIEPPAPSLTVNVKPSAAVSEPLWV